ncbi:hypothetical protein BDK51DRAFT_51660 [Blyttiomyces helicus]|uniref:SEP-domain-containing protein n=1 Tax=Blyttiomyces helicus TaxID=388810 RepID=A0A4P9WAU5_9FUNG|nr:hypothetical protein BDK51DRAFT_51660 [Blyttiomyces helicus]|eukprot:RKO88010.1 hypothetical protein BDK51DRAFT_51660 [Blyttiomyces helicus]
MDDATKQQLVETFTAATAVPEEQARFLLEAAGWDIQAATSLYFSAMDVDPSSEDESDVGPSSSSAAPAPASSAASSASKSWGSSRNAPAKSGSGARIKSFRDLAANSSDDEGEEEDKQNYFAGGEKSGVMLEGGPKDKPGHQDLVNDILQKAAKAGPPPDDSKKSKPAWSGSGNRLGSDEDAAAGPSAPVALPTPAVPSSEPVERHLTFWRNGFSIDDGPLRDYNDPVNTEFLRLIKSGRAPTHLLNVEHGQPVEVRVAHRLQEDYKPPPPKPAAPFSGSGNRLGGITPDSSTPPSEVILPGAFPGTAPSSTSGIVPSSVPILSVDDSLPITSVQIRLGDGTRLIAKFNHTHTVGDIRRFINASRPGEAGRNYNLQTTFPNRDLTDVNATLASAGLLNSVLLQRYV